MCAALSPLLAAAPSIARAEAESAADPAAPPGQDAARPAPLGLDQAVQTALNGHPLLSALRNELEGGDGAIRQADLPPNPTLSLEQEDTRAATRTRTLMLTQTLELGGKRAARTELARRDRDLAALELQARRAELRAGVTLAFHEVLIAQERLRVAQQSLQLAGSAAQAAAQRVTAGKVSPTEQTRAQVAQATAGIELRQARADLAAALQALCAAMGVAPGTVDAVQGRLDALPPLPEPELLAQRLQDAPQLQLARMAVQRAAAAAELERRRAVPDLSVGIGSQRAADLGRSQPMFSLSLPIPLFDRNQGAQLQALRRRDAAESLAQAEEQRLRAEVLQTAAQLQARLDEVQALNREVLPGAQSAYDAARRGFELGKFGFLDVLDAQRTLLQARGQYFAALSQAHRLGAELERRLGAPAGGR
ncbi:MAG: cobalt-zinc-cadmium resistance protein [Roseateles depolymerans]|uniref:Cobalt-zinc-cadmium resistance protein n=1 Tax=Roseateles depolymerans TaxID=76731 RepID=A0A2W5DRB4_9BURK|nr:MAG: cobalt-zinc-cadmium resistance protein [Roseateles depolymerans]